MVVAMNSTKKSPLLYPLRGNGDHQGAGSFFAVEVGSREGEFRHGLNLHDGTRPGSLCGAVSTRSCKDHPLVREGESNHGE